MCEAPEFHKDRVHFVSDFQIRFSDSPLPFWFFPLVHGRVPFSPEDVAQFASNPSVQILKAALTPVSLQ